MGRPAARDPAHTGWQRDLVVSYYNLARTSEQTGQAHPFWRNCHDVLRRMKAANMYLDPPLQQLLAALDINA